MALPISLVRCFKPASSSAQLSIHSSTSPRVCVNLQCRLFHQQPQPGCSTRRGTERAASTQAASRNPPHRSIAPSPLLLNRQYHSQYHPDPPEHEYTNSQITILSAALVHVPEHGFTLNALTLGARDAGFLDVSVQLLPRREFDLILFWLASRRGLLRAKVENGLFEDIGGEVTDSGSGPRQQALSVEQKAKILLMERLRMNEKIKHQWQDALALMSLPSHVPLSLSELHALSSDILTLAGDRSVDASWYTKRLWLSGVYAGAEVFMTHDSSPSFSDTEAFVDRRLEDVQAAREKIGGVKRCLGFMGSTALGLGRSWGLKI